MEDRTTYLQLFKQNKEIIVLVPTLLGFLYQVLNLLILVGLPYVRYFSVSQVIPDGLLISILIFWIYIAYKLINIFYKQLNSEEEVKVSDSKLFNTFYIFFFCSLGMVVFYYTYQINDFSSFQIILIRYLSYCGSALLFWAGLKHFLLACHLDKWLKSKKENSNNKTSNFVLNLLIITIFALFIKVVPNEIKVINELFIKVNNFKNDTYFSEEIKKAYNMKSEPTLLYINKEYAFLKIEEDKILVLDSKTITEIKK